MPPSHVSRSSRAKPSAHAVADGATFRKPIARKRRARLDGVRPRVGEALAAQRLFARAGGAHGLGRHVQPADPPVPAQILPEVRQLQRRAQRVRRSVQSIVTVAGDPQHQTAHRIGRAATVVEDVAPRGVAGRHDILTERAHEIVEQRDRKAERSDRVADGHQDSLVAVVGPVVGTVASDAGSRQPVVVVLAHAARCRPSLPALELRPPRVRTRGAFVGDVVGHAGERIERRDVGPHRRRQQVRGHREILVV